MMRDDPITDKPPQVLDVKSSISEAGYSRRPFDSKVVHESQCLVIPDDRHVLESSNSDLIRLLIKIPSERRNLLCFLDSGSDISIIKGNVARMFIREGAASMMTSDRQATGVTGDSLTFKGMIDVPLWFNNHKIIHRMYVADDIEFTGAILLGIDFLMRANANLEFGCDGTAKLFGRTFFYTKRPRDENFTSVTSSKINVTNSSNYEVKIRGSVTIEPFTMVRCPCNVVVGNNIKKIGNLSNLDEPNLTKTLKQRLQNLDIMVKPFNFSHDLKFESALQRVDKSNNITVGCINASNNPITLKNGLPIATASTFEEETESPSEISAQLFEDQLKEIDLSHVDDCQAERILHVLRENKNAFSSKESPIGHVKGIEHELNTVPGQIAYRPQYRHPQAISKKIEEMADELLQLGVVRECESPWNSPIILVKKKDGSFRFVADVRGVNKLTPLMPQPIPRIQETLDALSGKKFYSTLDCTSGYFNIDVRKEDQIKTAFQTPTRRLCFQRMPFGLCNSSFTFQKAINKILSDALGRYALAYIDDIVVFSDTFEDHLNELSKTLTLLRDGGLKLAIKKCKLFKSEIDFLGYKVNANGVFPNPEKLIAIDEYPQPKNQKNVRQFLATVGFYRQFIPNFAGISTPLSNLLRKDTKWKWEDEQRDAFLSLKNKMAEAPILKHPDFSKPFQIHTDASAIAIGGALMQEFEGKIHPIAYFSRKLRGPELRYTVSEWECLAIVASIKHFHYYVYGRHFTVVTDHAPLRTVFEGGSKNARINRWAASLLDYNFDCLYKTGATHHLPDALSRNIAIVGLKNKKIKKSKNDLKHLSDLFSYENVAREQRKEERWRDIINYLTDGPVVKCPPRTSIENFHVLHDCLYFTPKANIDESIRIVVPESLKHVALDIIHNQKLSAHSGFVKSIFRARQLFFWPNMLADVKRHCETCLDCQLRKPGIKNKAPLGTFPDIDQPMDRIGIDLIGPINESTNGSRYIFTIVDHFSRYVTLIPLRNKSSDTVAKAFVKFVLRHGAPKTVISDQGTEFVGEKFAKVCEELQIKTGLTTSFRPKSNGMTENKNKQIADMLSLIVKDSPETWDQQLDFVSAAMNSSYCSSTGDTPYFIFTGRDYNLHYGDILSDYSANRQEQGDYLQDMPTRLQKAFRRVKDLHKTNRQKTEKYHNRNTRLHKIQLGNLVLLRNETKAGGPFRKFNPRWTGPFRVIEVKTNNLFKIKGVHHNRKEMLVHTDRLKLLKTLTDPYEKFDELETVNHDLQSVEQSKNKSDNESSKKTNNDSESKDDEPIKEAPKTSNKKHEQQTKRLLTHEMRTNFDNKLDVFEERPNKTHYGLRPKIQLSQKGREYKSGYR